MGTHRWAAGALVLCALTGCKHWDSTQRPRNVPEKDDCRQYSVQESIEFYKSYLPPRGLYEIFAVAESPDPKPNPEMLPYSFVVVRIRDSRHPETKEPVIERIIGPVRGKEEWTDLFSFFRLYASAPPAGYYCWQNDCRGKYSPAGEEDPRDPYPPELPDHSAITTPAGTFTQAVPAGSQLLRDVPSDRGYGGSGSDTCTFVPRDTTVLTGAIVEKLRESARGVGNAVDNVPAVQGVQGVPGVPAGPGQSPDAGTPAKRE